ncbi:MAG TPA: hypothetical protein VNO30_39035 [Kofleriaceae bacterium]|nr:hypothetical protein [Kofleriaceae bacterium]
MSMRHAQLLVIGSSLLVAGTAAADKFGGFSGVDRPYLVNQDRVCTPLKVAEGAASGTPTCTQAAADVVARLSIKDPIPQAGTKGMFVATAAGRTLTVSLKATGTPVVTWTAADPIGKVTEVYTSQYLDRVAVAYTTRRLGKDVTDVIGFDLGQGAALQRSVPADSSGKAPGGKDPTGKPPPGEDPDHKILTGPDPSKDPTGKDPTAKDPTAAATAPAPPADPKVTAAVAAARKAPAGAKALAAWKAVLTLDGTHPEALFRVAAAQIAAKQPADALTTLGVLGGAARADAIEWLIEARFDPAFASLRSDAKFRAAVGLDRKPTSVYERMMGFGGQWEQSSTACDRPEIRFSALRDRTFKLRVKTACQGSVYDTPFKGTWRIEGARIVLTFPNKGKATTAADETACVFEAVGDEEGLKCTIGRDLEFTALPARR